MPIVFCSHPSIALLHIALHLQPSHQTRIPSSQAPENDGSQWTPAWRITCMKHQPGHCCTFTTGSPYKTDFVSQRSPHSRNDERHSRQVVAEGRSSPSGTFSGKVEYMCPVEALAVGVMDEKGPLSRSMTTTSVWRNELYVVHASTRGSSELLPPHQPTFSITLKHNSLTLTLTQPNTNMASIGEKISNTTNSYIGGAKETIGEKTGNQKLAAEGAAQKTQAEAAAAQATAKAHAEGVGHQVQGKVQKNVGSLTGDTSMQARGHANEARGDMESKV
ncbi:hypothetical protein B0O80DRAFT_448687 [Mortierella sp. GBAus27b]|nr:hypothetical protein B0O80DRAFT_448687 [Mortierella sp. GBAus27b]